jgi:hypothetical protein
MPAGETSTRRPGKPPRTHASKEKLRRLFQEQPARIEHAFTVLMDVYANVFGDDAADAFTKAIRAWHAGIEVTTNKPPAPEKQTERRGDATPTTKPTRISSCLPVPRPLPAAVAAGNFGKDEQDKPIRPSPQEVREITESFAEKLLDSKTDAEIQAGIARYAEDFGPRPAAQLEAYLRREKKARCR